MLLLACWHAQALASVVARALLVAHLELAGIAQEAIEAQARLVEAHPVAAAAVLARAPLARRPVVALVAQAFRGPERERK